LADERLAIGFSDGVALWTPGQTAPAPRLAIVATKLAWSPGHRLAIGDASGIGVYAVDLQPVAVGIRSSETSHGRRPAGSRSSIPVVFGHGPKACSCPASHSRSSSFNPRCPWS
jgi:hypothetical protein